MANIGIIAEMPHIRANLVRSLSSANARKAIEETNTKTIEGITWPNVNSVGKGIASNRFNAAATSIVANICAV